MGFWGTLGNIGKGLLVTHGPQMLGAISSYASEYINPETVKSLGGGL